MKQDILKAYLGAGGGHVGVLLDLGAADGAVLRLAVCGVERALVLDERPLNVGALEGAARHSDNRGLPLAELAGRWVNGAVGCAEMTELLAASGDRPVAALLTMMRTVDPEAARLVAARRALGRAEEAVRVQRGVVEAARRVHAAAERQLGQDVTELARRERRLAEIKARVA